MHNPVRNQRSRSLSQWRSTYYHKLLSCYGKVTCQRSCTAVQLVSSTIPTRSPDCKVFRDGALFRNPAETVADGDLQLLCRTVATTLPSQDQQNVRNNKTNRDAHMCRSGSCLAWCRSLHAKSEQGITYLRLALQQDVVLVNTHLHVSPTRSRSSQATAQRCSRYPRVLQVVALPPVYSITDNGNNQQRYNHREHDDERKCARGEGGVLDYSWWLAVATEPISAIGGIQFRLQPTPEVACAAVAAGSSSLRAHARAFCLEKQRAQHRRKFLGLAQLIFERCVRFTALDT